MNKLLLTHSTDKGFEFQENTWSGPIPSGPGQISDHTVNVVNGEFYILSDRYFRKYNPRTNSRTTLLSDGKFSYTGHSSVTVGTDIYYFGRISNDRNLHRYDTLTNEWTDLGYFSSFFYGASLVLYDRYILLFGGNQGTNSSNPTGTVTYYDIKNGTTVSWSSDSSRTSLNHTAHVYGDYMYVFGGTRYPSSQFHAIRRFNLINHKWEDLPWTSFRMAGHCSEIIGKHVYLAGGTNSFYNGYLFGGSNRFYRYDLETLVLTQLEDIPSPYELRDSTLTFDGEALHFIGGRHSQVPSTTHYVYR